MASRARRASRGRIGLFWILAGGAAAAGEGECGAYEDAERASYRELSWEDFQGPVRPVKAKAGDLSVTTARIVTSIRIDALEVHVEPGGTQGWIARPSALCVRAYVLKVHSGQRHLKTGEVLRHEQGHFDLTQAHALRLRDRIAGLAVEASSSEAAERELLEATSELYREALAETQREQARYDRQTDHGHRGWEQARWTAELTTRLALGPKI